MPMVCSTQVGVMYSIHLWATAAERNTYKTFGTFTKGPSISGISDTRRCLH